MVTVQQATMRVHLRSAAAIIAALDAALWLYLAYGFFLSGGEPATAGLDRAGGGVVTVLFCLTGVPALLLAWRGRAPRAALLLALAFPTVFLSLLALVAATLS
jgi:hypothetical protein